MAYEEMTSMQRVLTTLGLKEPDRVPLFLLPITQGAVEMGVLLKRYYHAPDLMAEAQVLFRERYRNDCLCGFTYAAAEFEAFGGDTIFYDRAPPNAGAPVFRTAADLEQFSYAISHDMRQPLRMISSYLQLIEMGLADQLVGEKRDYFNFAIDGAKRIDQMLVALLEYSRIGRMGEPPTWIDSGATLDEALQFLQPAVTEARANLSITGAWPRIFASHDEIQQLVQNLIGNAIKYRVAGRIPEITVSSERADNEWRLCVTDNGVGIIPEQSKRLFQVFQRLHSHEAYAGTGIGLALCRKIAEHHRGRIWAESAGEGQGSRFCVALPVLSEDAALATGKII
ncbi:MAG: ATP-binding protein [Sideroxyarcus sp.]|nr:ATP-binding protein [Sideroxyarcus sp.]